MDELKKEITEIVGGREIRYVLDEATGTYLPDWELPPQKEIGRYGRMRLKFLKENCSSLYQAMCLKGTLNEHLAEVDDRAYERINSITKAMSKADGLTDEMKNTDQLYWVGMMNNYRNSAEEIILNELIYV
ncbi:MAG: TnpV protein [Ruminococcus sp.]|nr:TnpV protein [Ruminococcus sp.]